VAEQQPCPRCGYENDGRQGFCGSCGNQLIVSCDRCGATSPPGFSFCGRCGTPLQGSAEPPLTREERRVVSVIFVDLVGFTARAERLDPEDVRAMLTSYYTPFREQIESFGGTVEKFIGDAVMGVFGAPVAHGDDPERAVRAALGIIRGVSDVRAADSDRGLEVRIGVNTGEAIVALDARPRDGEAMVAGDVVNTAARLQTAAPANAILVGEETFRCTRSTIDYEPVEPLIVKGKELPLAAWRVRRASRQAGDRPTPDVGMVGRDSELATLIGVWQRVLTDRQPHLMTILGLPGVGKSRLAAEFMAAVRQAGARVVLGRSLPYGKSSAYDAFAQQVRNVAGVLGGDPPEVVVQKLRRTIEDLIEDESAEEVVRHLALMIGLQTVGSTNADTVSGRHILFASATRFVQALASRQPTVLVFEDLHWADVSLLQLIELMSAQAGPAPLLLLAAARPELRETLPGWGTSGPASVDLALEPLGQQHSRELADQLLARAAQQVLGQTADAISETGEGNPLFIEELVAAVTERSSPAGSQLPTSIRGIIAARLDSIPAPERAVLLDASVVGRVFWDGALSRLAPSRARLPELLDSLEGRDLIRRESATRFPGQQQYRIKHALIRDVAYAALPRARRRAAHAAAAAFFEDLHGEHDSPAAVGHHWLQAGDRERAAAYFVEAADRASRGWAKEEAVALYRQALTLVAEDDPQRRRELRLKLAVALQMLYHVSDAEGGTRDRKGPSPRP
jgi:class 3 adenylate cyclase